MKQAKKNNKIVVIFKILLLTNLGEIDFKWIKNIKKKRKKFERDVTIDSYFIEPRSFQIRRRAVQLNQLKFLSSSERPLTLENVS